AAGPCILGGPMSLSCQLFAQALDLPRDLRRRRSAMARARRNRGLGRQGLENVRRESRIDGGKILVGDLGESDAAIFAAPDQGAGDLMGLRKRYPAPGKPVGDFGGQRAAIAR